MYRRIAMLGADRGDASRTEAAERAAGVIDRYAPCSLSEPAAAFAREVVALADPPTPARCKALLFAAGRLGGFGERVGLELSAGVLLHGSVIERFVLTGAGGVSPATRRTLRTNLRYLARAVERYPQPAPVALARERAKAPYNAAEIDAFLRLAACQSTEARRMRASALICLGAGAGIITGELRHVRGTDVVARSGGVLVQLGGARARLVPVLYRYHERLLKTAAFAGGRYRAAGTRIVATSPTACPRRCPLTARCPACRPAGSGPPGLWSAPGGSGCRRSCTPPGSPAASGSGTSPRRSQPSARPS
jgi:hypothetical protein